MADKYLVRDLFDSIRGRELPEGAWRFLLPDAPQPSDEFDPPTVLDWLMEIDTTDALAQAWFSLEAFAADHHDIYLEWLDEGTTGLTPSSASAAKICAHFDAWVAYQMDAAADAGQMELPSI